MTLRQLLTLLTIIGTGRLVNAAFICAKDGFQCSSCNTLAFCAGDQVAMEVNCPDNQWCSDPGACFPLDSDKLTQCKCDKFPSFLADPFDTQKYLLCESEGEQSSATCKDGEAFSEDDKGCAEQPPLECNKTGFFPVLPSCDSYYSCKDDGSGGYTPSGLTKCPDDKPVFDIDNIECTTKEAIQIDQTPTCPAGDLVAAPDNLECNAFHLCQGEEAISGPICCPSEDEVFNVDTMLCEEDKGQVECPTLNPCDDKEYTYSCKSSERSSA